MNKKGGSKGAHISAQTSPNRIPAVGGTDGEGVVRLRCLQLKTAIPHSPANQSLRNPPAPPVYRPLSVPKVLQTKATGAPPQAPGQAHQHPNAALLVRNPQKRFDPRRENPLIKHVSLQPLMNVAKAVAPPAYQPQPLPGGLQSKVNGGQSALVKSSAPRLKLNTLQTRAAVAQPALPRATVQRFTPQIVQAKATKFYPNLHPGAVEPVDRSNIFRLDSFANQYRLHRVDSHGVNVPNQQYNFVRTSEGEMLLHSRYRHPSIAEGKQVLYAGEIFFNNGKLQWWSNGSGHYQPYVEDAGQANLPMDSFYSYQQIIKGEHTRKKG